MTNERAYQYIKERDLPNLKEVVEILKSQSLDVYISGSALMDPSYGDIDILICDPNFVFKSTDNEAEFELSPRAKAAVENIIGVEGVDLKKKDHEYSGGYSGSAISGYRWEFNYKGSAIDISFAKEPGGLTREKIARLEAEMGGGDLGLVPDYEKF